MDHLITRSDRLKKKLEDLDFEMYAAKAKMDRARINKNYYKYMVISSEKNLAELSRDNITVNMREFAKIRKELAMARERLAHFLMEYSNHVRFLEAAIPRYEAMKMEYDDIINQLQNRKVILLFKRKT